MLYATDSYHGALMVMDANKALKEGMGEVSSFLLPDVFDVNAANDEYGANGIVAYGSNDVLVAHELLGSIWAVDLRDGSFRRIIEDDDTTGPDGLTIKNERLYVTQNINNKIGVYEISKKKKTGNKGGNVVRAKKIG